jgi:hypothetical protein
MNTSERRKQQQGFETHEHHRVHSVEVRNQERDRKKQEQHVTKQEI